MVLVRHSRDTMLTMRGEKRDLQYITKSQVSMRCENNEMKADPPRPRFRHCTEEIFMATLTSVHRPWALHCSMYAQLAVAVVSVGRRAQYIIARRALLLFHISERGARQSRERGRLGERSREGGECLPRKGDHEDLRDGRDRIHCARRRRRRPPADRQKVAGFAADPREIFHAFLRRSRRKGRIATSGPTQRRGITP